MVQEMQELHCTKRGEKVNLDWNLHVCHILTLGSYAIVNIRDDFPYQDISEFFADSYQENTHNLTFNITIFAITNN